MSRTVGRLGVNGAWFRPARSRLALVLLAAATALIAMPALAKPALAKRDARPRHTHRYRLGPLVSVTLTQASLRAALKPMRPVRFSSAPTHVRTLTLDPATTYQHMLGFGGAMTDSSAWLLYDKLAPEARDAAMRALFSPSADGIHLNFVRVPIGASDFTANGVPYSYDDLPRGKTDPALAGFSIAHDEAYIIPALQQMLAIHPGVELLASEWSAPAWMKTNGAPDNLGYQGRPIPAYFRPLALYITKFIWAYQQAGIPIWGITPQNEPNAPAPYPGMTFTPATESQFISENLVPTLASANLHTLIFGGDDTNLSLAHQLMQGPAADRLAGMAWHCYQGQQVISQFHQLYPSTVNLLSECSPGIIPYGAAEAAIDGARNWAAAINLWNLALDPSGGPVEAPNGGCLHCTGLLTVSESRHNFTPNLTFYELGQLSKFVAPGAVRIKTQRWVGDYAATRSGGSVRFGVTTGLDNVAFRNPDGTYVLICHQNAKAPVIFGVQANGLRFKYRLGGQDTATFTWRAPTHRREAPPRSRTS